jgi:hypothetical protein
MSCSIPIGHVDVASAKTQHLPDQVIDSRLISTVINHLPKWPSTLIYRSAMMIRGGRKNPLDLPSGVAAAYRIANGLEGLRAGDPC